MRQFFMFLLIGLMLGGTYFAYRDLQAYSNANPIEPDSIPTGLMLGNAPLDPDIKARMDEVFDEIETTIKTANNSGKRSANFSYWLGWVSFIASLAILGITVLAKTNASDTRDEASSKTATSKLESKAIATGVLAVIAAVCPPAISKFDSDSTKKYETADLLRNEKSSVRTQVMTGQLAMEKSLELLDRLMDKAGR